MTRLCVTVGIILSLFVASGRADEGRVEIRVAKEVLQSFVSAYLPVTIQHEVPFLGIFKVPLTVRLSRPGPLVIEPTGEGRPNLTLEVDYELSMETPLPIPPSRGRARGALSTT
ncbi:MAG: hypothetical protein N2Z74_06410, partial [Syntrophales bacterium]|nr:hypothetical protein [Syntrophales bacterium]